MTLVLALMAVGAAATVPAKPTEADWRTPAPETVLVIDTNKGRVLVELAPEIAPLHVERIRLLAGLGFYDNLFWHRVIDQFMAQTGDPKDDGTGGSDKPNLAAEFTFRRGAQTPFIPVADQTVAEVGFLGPLPVMTQSSMLMAMTADNKISGWALYCPGVAGAARDENPDSANSQFFIVFQPRLNLDKKYTVFGRVIAGMQYVDAITRGEPPATPSRITHAYIAADSPPAYAPPPPPAPLPTLVPAQAATVSATPAAPKLVKPAPKPAARVPARKPARK